MLTLCLVVLQLEFTLQLRLLIQLLQKNLVLHEELSGVFSTLRELLLQRVVETMSLLQLQKSEKPMVIKGLNGE